MYYAVAYDISNNKTRRLAEKLCKKAGLVRVQRSIFMGKTQGWRIADLRIELEPLLNARTDSLSIQPLDKAAFEAAVFVGKEVNKDEVARKQLIVFI